MAATATANQDVMLYEDPVVTDELFGNVVRNIFWGGFSVMVLARVAMAITSMVFFFDATNSVRSVVPGSLTTFIIFSMVDTLATLAFSGGFVVAALVHSRMPAWTRVTMLSVAALILVGSNVASIFSLANLLN